MSTPAFLRSLAKGSLCGWTYLAVGAAGLALMAPAVAQQEQSKRAGEWCQQDIAEIESDLQSQRSGPVIAGAAGGGQKQQQQGGPDQQDLQQLQQAARIFHRYGRNDACRMVVFEMRQILSFDGMKGTNSP